ncbi:MAG: AMP-binding protein [Eubacteriales bacterium]|nr:AMP-binding protein [Eubacteriales bacterium]
MKNILEYLETTAKRFPDKPAFVCGEESVTFGQLRRRAASYGRNIAARTGNRTGRPVCVVGEREIDALVCMLACVYSGNYYVPVDSALPQARIAGMLETVDFLGVICVSGQRFEAEKLAFSDVYVEDIKPSETVLPGAGHAGAGDTASESNAGSPDGRDGAGHAGAGDTAPENTAAEHRDTVRPDAAGTKAGRPDAASRNTGFPEPGESDGDLDRFIAGTISHSRSFDPLYGIFTSGSTGVPRLVVKSHGALISFVDTFVEMFGFTQDDVLGNQFAFYFDASTKDLFACLKCGLTVHIIPKVFFSFPQKLVPYLMEHQITKIIWVPSALVLVANADSLETIGVPGALEDIFFVGEQMPVRQLNYWKAHLPQARFVNIYGSTETAGNFLFHVYDEILPDDARLPTGRPFPNTKVFLLDEKGREVTETGEEGEICVVSETLSQGYYGCPEMTNAVFVQNPLVPYREVMYRTGDLASYDEDGNIVWQSRRDFQIKHMGYRIELSEIEVVIGAIPQIEECCCVYDGAAQKILLYYQAKEDLKKVIGKQVREKLPKYMFPSKYVKIEQIPHNANGKIDRRKLASLS